MFGDDAHALLQNVDAHIQLDAADARERLAAEAGVDRGVGGASRDNARMHHWSTAVPLAALALLAAGAQLSGGAVLPLLCALTTASAVLPTALVISYRNDEGAPRGDGVAKFGIDEWEDLEAAIAYARSRGASDVILGAGSMGGAITLSLFEHGSAQAQAVRGIVLDSPALAIGRQSRMSTDAMGVPGVIAELGFGLAAWRFGLDWEAMDYLSAVEHVTVPVLVLHGDRDALISVEANRPVYEALTGRGGTTVEIVPGAHHLGIWNRDRAGFERHVSQFLARVAGAGP